jgi:hypothetical protein
LNQFSHIHVPAMSFENMLNVLYGPFSELTPDLGPWGAMERKTGLRNPI